MTADDIREFLRDLPKCEHHMHLEGALEPDLLFDLAARNKINLPSADDDTAFASPAHLLERYERFTSLDDFLAYYFIGMSCLVQEDDFFELAWRYFKKAKSDGVVHAEVFFDPQAHTGRGISYKKVLTGFLRACRRAEEELEISTNIIVCFLRHLPVADSEKTYAEVEADLQSGQLAGIGLDSSERDLPPGQWSNVYQKAKVAGIKRTAHAGEEGPVEYIKEALQTLDIQRIDHGIKLADDENLLREVAGQKTLVTMCPVSNVKLQCVQNVEQLPVKKFLEAEVAFSINSDDPAYFKAYILDVYYAVQDAFHLTIQDWETIAINAINGSWCDESRKQALRTAVKHVVRRYQNISR